MPPPKKPKDGPTRLEAFLSEEELIVSESIRYAAPKYKIPSIIQRKNLQNIHTMHQQDAPPPPGDNEDSNASVSIIGWPSSASFSHLLEDSNNPDLPQDLTMQSGPRTPRTNTGNATPTDWLFPSSLSRPDDLSPSASNPPTPPTRTAQPAHFHAVMPDDSTPPQTTLKPVIEAISAAQTYLPPEYLFKTIDSLQDLMSNDTGSPIRLMTPKNYSPAVSDGSNFRSLLPSPLLHAVQDVNSSDGEAMTSIILPLLSSHVSSAVPVVLNTSAQLSTATTVTPANLIKQERCETTTSTHSPQQHHIITVLDPTVRHSVCSSAQHSIVTPNSQTTSSNSINMGVTSNVTSPNYGSTTTPTTQNQYIIVNKSYNDSGSTTSNVVEQSPVTHSAIPAVSINIDSLRHTDHVVQLKHEELKHEQLKHEQLITRTVSDDIGLTTNLNFENAKATSPPADVSSSTGPADLDQTELTLQVHAKPAVRKAESGNSIPSDRQCLICNDCGSGFHYGVWSCEGCKAFFKRSLQGAMNYICPATNNCTIDKRRRKCCPACRLDKCVAMGMTKSESRRERGKNKKRKGDVIKTEEDAPKPAKISKEATGKRGSSAKRSPSLVESLLRITTGTAFKTNHDNNLPDSELHLMSSFVELLHNELIAIVNWAKAMPGYKALSVPDQGRLLETAWMELLVLQLCCRSMSSESDELVFAQDLHMNMERFRVARIEKIGVRLLGLTSRFTQLQVTPEEIVILRSIALLNADVICVDNPERVQNLRSELMAALVTATSSHQKTGPGGPRRDPQRMGHLLLLLPHIREASTMVIVHLFHLQRRKAVHVGALLGELLAGTEARLGQCISGTIGMGDCSAQPLL